MQMSIQGSIPMMGQTNNVPQSPVSHKLGGMLQRLPDQPHHPPLNSAYQQPSNYWPAPDASLRSSPAAPSATRPLPSITRSQSISQHLPHHYHNNHTFDFVLALGQDEKLLTYVNTLDLFAPVTCTTVDLNKNRGTEAAYYLAQSDVREALEEMVGFRARDLKWAHR